MFSRFAHSAPYAGALYFLFQNLPSSCFNCRYLGQNWLGRQQSLILEILARIRLVLRLDHHHRPAFLDFVTGLHQELHDPSRIFGLRRERDLPIACAHIRQGVTLHHAETYHHPVQVFGDDLAAHRRPSRGWIRGGLERDFHRTRRFAHLDIFHRPAADDILHQILGQHIRRGRPERLFCLPPIGVVPGEEPAADDHYGGDIDDHRHPAQASLLGKSICSSHPAPPETNVTSLQSAVYPGPSLWTADCRLVTADSYCCALIASEVVITPRYRNDVCLIATCWSNGVIAEMASTGRMTL